MNRDPAQGSDGARRGAGPARWERLQTRADALFGDSRRAFRAFADLDELAENLRVLSLNAELAAGRAGEAGRAVRALTQYTRELVNRLGQIEADMERARARIFDLSAGMARDLMWMRLLERATAPDAGGSAAAQRTALVTLVADIVAGLAHLADGIGRLAHRAHEIEEVVTQADSIATNIAIEASSVGSHEIEFRTVSDTMRRYVESLRSMIEVAADAVRRAGEKNDKLRSAGAGIMRELQARIG